MPTAHTALSVVTAAANLSAAALDLRRPPWILANMERLGVPQSQMLPLGALKAAGGAGLLIGLGVPVIGVAAAAGLTLFFSGAIVVTLRARWFAHLPYPALYLALAAGTLALSL